MEYPRPGSRGFPKFVRSLTKDFCPTSGLRDHQKVVAKFMSKDAPYRGLLLVHGLGSGKGLSSIGAIAAAGRPAWIILPASLKNNFLTALEHDVAKAEFACNGTAKPDVNFLSLNGLTKNVIANLERGPNPFDNRVIVVDECHVMMQNVAGATDPGSLMRRLYDLLYRSHGSKILLLSATPLINQPVELAWTLNLVHGPVTTYSLRWSRPLVSADMELAKAALMKCAAVMKVIPSHTGARIELAPEGFSVSSRTRRTLVRGAVPESAVIASVAKYAAKGAVLEPTSAPLFDVNTFKDTYISKGAVVKAPELARKMLGLVSNFMIRDAALFPKETYETVKLPMSDTQFGAYAAAREVEREVDLKNAGKEDAASLHLSYSRSVLNFVFPAKDAAKVYKSEVRALLKAESKSTSKAAVDREHAALMETAVRKLKGSDIWTNDALLKEHSPKFYAILKSLLRDPGCAMLYSSFRNLEGLGLMSHLLRKRGFRELKVVRTDGKDRRFGILGAGKGPVFINPVLNTEDGNDLVALYNGLTLPPKMHASALRLFGKDLDNRRGEIIKLIMLGVSGAKGIDLKCVRTVHIMEPHWHATQLDQVAGRASRAGSHASLRPEERNVRVALYVSTFSDGQASAPGFGTIAKADKGLTSDEVLVAVSARKKRVLGGLTKVMELAAIDCSLWGSKCYEPDL
jgi:Helicase conserved C-terminal domain